MSVEERDRLAQLRDAMDRRMSRRGIPTHRQLVQIYDGGSIPTTVPAMFLSHVARIDVAEAEGATSTIIPDTAEEIPVLVLGPLVPVAGDNLMATVIGGRWVAEKQGATAPDGVHGYCRGSSDATACPVFPLTMHFTDSIMGSCVITYTGGPVGVWLGTFVYHNPGSTFACNSGNTCDAKDITIYAKFDRDGGICFMETSCKTTDSGLPFCPDDAGPFGPGLLAFGSPSTVTCSPFHASRTFDLALMPCEIQLMYGADSGMVTQTVTS